MIFAGLTGGIATGKSMVSMIFRSLGAQIIDADVIAREIVKPGLPAWQEIVDRFGKDILLGDGSINRQLLGKTIFKDSIKREILNSIMHPRILKEAARLREEIKEVSSDAVVIFDAALLIETGAHEMVDLVILVYVDEERQIRRLMDRDGLSRVDAIEKIRAQIPIEEKREYADFIIDTSVSQEDVGRQVRYIYERLRGLSIKGKNQFN